MTVRVLALIHRALKVDLITVAISALGIDVDNMLVVVLYPYHGFQIDSHHIFHVDVYVHYLFDYLVDSHQSIHFFSSVLVPSQYLIDGQSFNDSF